MLGEGRIEGFAFHLRDLRVELALGNVQGCLLDDEFQETDLRRPSALCVGTRDVRPCRSVLCFS